MNPPLWTWQAAVSATWKAFCKGPYPVWVTIIVISLLWNQKHAAPFSADFWTQLWDEVPHLAVLEQFEQSVESQFEALVQRLCWITSFEVSKAVFSFRVARCCRFIFLPSMGVFFWGRFNPSTWMIKAFATTNLIDHGSNGVKRTQQQGSVLPTLRIQDENKASRHHFKDCEGNMRSIYISGRLSLRVFAAV